MTYEMPAGSAEAKYTTLSDGRKLQYFENDIQSTDALVLHHGTPGLGSQWQPWLDAAAERGIRAIAFTKAGYFGSDRAPLRSVAEAGADLAQLLQHAGVSSFVSIGWSGGGPYALQSTFLDANKGAETMAGVASFFAMGPDFVVGLPENETVDVIKARAADRAAAAEYAAKDLAGIEQVWTLENFHENDAKRARYAEFADLFETTNAYLVPALLNAVVPDHTGILDDDHAIITDWGFDLGEISKPVSIWNGMLDKAVPPGHAIWLHSQIPGSDLHLLGDQTHGSIAVEYLAEILESAILKLHR